MPNNIKNMERIGFGELCDLMEQSEVERTLDLGSTILHIVHHVHKGSLLLVSTVDERAAVVSL